MLAEGRLEVLLSTAPAQLTAALKGCPGEWPSCMSDLSTLHMGPVPANSLVQPYERPSAGTLRQPTEVQEIIRCFKSYQVCVLCIWNSR